MKVSILGEGEFGKAVKAHFSRLGYEVSFNIESNSEIVFVAIPSYAVSPTLIAAKENLKNKKIIIGSKGFDGEEKLLSEKLKDDFPNQVFFLYGPSLSKELRDDKLTAMVLAGGEGKEELKKKIESENLHIELSDDIVGVQVGATLKNVITIFVGILESSGYGENAQAFVFTKGVQEIQKIGVALGADPNTFFGLSCIGDLTLHSRNRFIGIEIGKGRKLEDIIPELKMEHIPEGVTALEKAHAITKKLSIKAPFIETLYSIIFENLPLKDAIEKIK